MTETGNERHYLSGKAWLIRLNKAEVGAKSQAY